MKTGYIFGVAASVAALVSYVLSALCIDLIGVAPLSKIGVVGRLCGHLLSLASCLGLLVFFGTGLAKCNRDDKESKMLRENCVRLTRAQFWSRARFVYPIELFVAFPMSIWPFIWHKSFTVYSFWATTPIWCVGISVVGLLLIVGLKAVMLPVVVRRFYDCNLPKWLAVALFLFSFAPKVWWLSSVITVMIAGFVAGTQGENRYGEDPRLESVL
jgi:uncharacterized membrane protein YhaH (DUF805 family)